MHNAEGPLWVESGDWHGRFAMWTKEQRAIYWRDEDRYPSNLTDAEWERLKPLMILREQLGREASRTAAVIGSQTLKAAEKGAVLTAR